MIATVTASTTVYEIALSRLAPVGKLIEQDLDVIADLALFSQDGRGFFTRGDQSITFEVGTDTLKVGYSRVGRHALV